MADLAQQKAQLRLWAKERRSSVLKPDTWRDVARLHGLLEASPGVKTAVFASRSRVGGYAAMPGESDPSDLMAALALSGVRLALPVMQGRSEPLLFRAWKPGDPLRKAVWGIEQPLETADAVRPTVLVVPLLAVDRHGHRLGYGAGYYDRTIQHLRQMGPLTTIGLALPELILDAVPHTDYDEPLDWILTPNELIACPRSA